VGSLALEIGLVVAPGTCVVVGPNGAGKSSLLSFLLGVRRPERGRIAVGDQRLFDAEKGIDVPIEARRLGYVPQDFALFPHLSVAQNVAFALGSQPDLDRTERVERLTSILAELGIGAFAQRDPRTLSGGERQRVALARALATRPKALLLDEPLAALDIPSRREVRAFLARYLEKLALPTLVVTHDARDARWLGDRIAALEAGRITQSGTWADLAAHPKTPFVEQFVASASWDADQAKP
jgi:molybdate transport system ATP-binding protein